MKSRVNGTDFDLERRILYPAGPSGNDGVDRRPDFRLVLCPGGQCDTSFCDRQGSDRNDGDNAEAILGRHENFSLAIGRQHSHHTEKWKFGKLARIAGLACQAAGKGEGTARGSAMIASIGSGLEFFRQVLDLRAYRQEILSADIANASTPGFKAVDLDFAEAMQNTAPKPAQTAGRNAASSRPAGSGHVWLVDDPRHIKEGGGASRDPVLAEAARSVKYQAGGEVTLDGNSVSLDHEKTAAAENAVQYEAAATFTAQTVKMMLIAINGSGPQQGG